LAITYSGVGAAPALPAFGDSLLTGAEPFPPLPAPVDGSRLLGRERTLVS
jgi:hypothetical protein